ncbi:MAG: hypothetical protein Q9162_004797 [Coniocarpon cinnabarinum]
MDDPINDIEPVIRALTQSPPSVQRTALHKYFTSDAEFIHPFCRTGSFDNSRFLIQAIYRWYKIMSPNIELDVKSIGVPGVLPPSYQPILIRGSAYDQQNLILYVTIFQVFSIFFVPFFKAPVELTTVLKLKKASNNKYYIASQNDLYQTDQFFKFFSWPFGSIFVTTFQLLSTLVCVVAAVAFWPISWWEEHGTEVRNEAHQDVARVEARLRDTFVDTKRNGELVTAPATSQ